MTIASDRSHAVRDGLVGWWRRRRQRAASLAELAFLSGEAERIASDAGVSVGDLRVLAGKWPDAADPVERRMAALGIDATQVEETQPAVMRDLQRVCSMCDEKRMCTHDLNRDPADPAWRDYCPNAETLGTLSSRTSDTSGH